MLLTGSAVVDADRAFTRELRARRRAALLRRVRRGAAAADRLPLYGEPTPSAGHGFTRGIREIPLAAIGGTLEPSRSALFDGCFRPAAGARRRWERLWIAEQCGAVLPPISVVAVGDGFAVRDGHHRVSVARARGAVTIDAHVDAA